MPIAKAFQEEHAGLEDGFLLQIDGNNHSIESSTYIGGTQFDAGWNILVDSSDNPIIVGWTQSTDFPSDGGYNGGISDVFLCSFSFDSEITSEIPITTILLISGVGISLALIMYILYRKR